MDPKDGSPGTSRGQLGLVARIRIGVARGAKEERGEVGAWKKFGILRSLEWGRLLRLGECVRVEVVEAVGIRVMEQHPGHRIRRAQSMELQLRVRERITNGIGGVEDHRGAVDPYL